MRTREDRSLGELFADLSGEISALVRQEVALAKLEVTENATRVGSDVAILALGGVILYAGFLALIAALVVGLAEVLDSVVLSAFIVAFLVLGGGYYCVRRGLNNLKRDNLAPRETLDSVALNVSWVKEQL